MTKRMKTWVTIKRFFRESETIAWARFQAVLGVSAIVLTYVDPVLLQPILSPKGFSIFLLANAVATEYLRRRRHEPK